MLNPLEPPMPAGTGDGPLSRLSALVGRVTCSPAIGSASSAGSVPCLVVVAMFDDAYHPGQRIEVAMHFPFPCSDPSRTCWRGQNLSGLA